MSKKVYVKLGEKALSFFDPTSRLQLAKGEVIEIEKSKLITKKATVAMRQGHLSYAFQEEFEKFQDSKNRTVETVKPNADPILEKKNRELEKENTTLRAELEAARLENSKLREVIDGAESESDTLNDLSLEELRTYLNDEENGFSEKEIKKGMKLTERDDLQSFIEELEEKRDEE